jgi:hypothetical protein
MDVSQTEGGLSMVEVEKQIICAVARKTPVISQRENFAAGKQFNFELSCMVTFIFHHHYHHHQHHEALFQTTRSLLLLKTTRNATRKQFSRKKKPDKITTVVCCYPVCEYLLVVSESSNSWLTRYGTLYNECEKTQVS